MFSKITSGSTRAISCIWVRIAPNYVGSVVDHRFPGHSSLRSLHKLFDISQQSMTLVLGWLLALFLGRFSPLSAGQPQLSLKTNSNVFFFPSHTHLPSTDEPSSVFISAPFIPSLCRKWEGSDSSTPSPSQLGSSFDAWGNLKSGFVASTWKRNLGLIYEVELDILVKKF